MNLNNSDRFISPADARAALQAFRRACLEWPLEVVAHEVSQVLLEEHEPDAARARSTHQGVVRLINHYLGDAHVADPPEWLTPLVTELISQRLRALAQ